MVNAYDGFPYERIEAAHRYLQLLKPWWGGFGTKLKIVPVYQAPGLDEPYGAVMSTDAGMRLYIDRSFALRAPFHELAGQLEHEYRHHTNDTWNRLRWLDEEMWARYFTICVDLEINSDIEHEARQFSMDIVHALANRSVVFTLSDLTRWQVSAPPSLPSFAWTPGSLGLPERLSAEEYYALLKKADDEREREEEQQEDEPENEEEDEQDQDENDALEDFDDEESEDVDSGDGESSDADADAEAGEDGDPLSEQKKDGGSSDKDSEDTEDTDGDEEDSSEPSESDDAADTDAGESELGDEDADPQEDTGEDLDDAGGEESEDTGDQDDQEGDESDAEDSEGQEDPGNGEQDDASSEDDQSSPSDAEEQSQNDSELGEDEKQESSSDDSSAGDPTEYSPSSQQEQGRTDSPVDLQDAQPIDTQAAELGRRFEEMLADPMRQIAASEMANPADPLTQQHWMPEEEDNVAPRDISEVEKALEQMAEDIELLREEWQTSGRMGPQLDQWAKKVNGVRRIKWESRFNRFLNSAVSSVKLKGQSDLSYSTRNPNQPKVGVILPGLSSYAPTIAVLQDVSASMLSNERMAHSQDVFTQLTRAVIGRFQSQVTWLSADTELRDVGKTSRWSQDLANRLNQGYGATNFGYIIEKLMTGDLRWQGRKVPKPDLLVICTDCEFTWPEKRPSFASKLLVVCVGQQNPHRKDESLKSWMRWDARDYLPEWLKPTEVVFTELGMNLGDKMPGLRV